MSLATDWRPRSFGEVVGQEAVVRVLERQVESGSFAHAYLFCGPSGDGKTTMARIFASAVNKGHGAPIEIDAASNNGVDQVRALVEEASERSLDGEYKVLVVDECVSGDTEVLTDEGFKRFDCLDGTELIAQYDNGKIEYVKPYEYIERDYTGKMYEISIGTRAKFLMSPNHVQPLYYVKSQKIKEKYVKDIRPSDTNRFVRSGMGAGELQHLTSLDRLALALQADGNLVYNYNKKGKQYNYWGIQVSKEEKKQRLAEILRDSGCEYKKLKSPRQNYVRYSVKTPVDVTKFLGTHFDLTKMSGQYANEFIQELMAWDGCVTQGKYLHYSCVDKRNVDFCQSVSILGGYLSRTGVERDARRETFHDVHRLYLRKGELSSPNQCVDKKQIDYSGKIYCVKVPSHQIFIRRDGYELMTGNCHMITTAGWNAFLKGIEEAPKYTIYIFCTTDPQKIPATIANRCMRFNFSKIPTAKIEERLRLISSKEGYSNYDEACGYIARMADGGMRDAISMLEKCADYDRDLSMDNVLKCLGNMSYDTLFDLVNSMVDGDRAKALSIVDGLCDAGVDMRSFAEQFLGFCLDLCKYSLTHDASSTSVPASLEKVQGSTRCLAYAAGIENAPAYFSRLSGKALALKAALRNDFGPRTTAEAYVLSMCGGD